MKRYNDTAQWIFKVLHLQDSLPTTFENNQLDHMAISQLPTTN